MEHTTFYQQLLGIESPWKVTDTELSLESETVTVTVAYDRSEPLRCPKCGKSMPGYDSRPRRWRDLDSHRCKTWIVADVPRVACSEHGVQQVPVPWAESKARYTLRFEIMAIDLLKRAISPGRVGEFLGISWGAVDRIMERAVERGLMKRTAGKVRHICVDETAVRRGHNDSTIVSDDDTGAVLYVGDNRTSESLGAYFESLSTDELNAIETVSIDMWEPYIKAIRQHLPDADSKICFDRFHVAQHLNRAVDLVRRREHRDLTRQGDHRLKKTKYLWLTGTDRMTTTARERFERIRYDALRVGRAWGLKEAALDAMTYTSVFHGRRAWTDWFAWADRSRLEPMRAVSRMVKKYLRGILNGMKLRRSNARAEATNAQIQKIKYNAQGYRNTDRMKRVILFFLAKLDLYPDPVNVTLPT